MSFLRKDLLSGFSHWTEPASVLVLGGLGLLLLRMGWVRGHILPGLVGFGLLVLAGVALAAFRRGKRLAGTGGGAGIVQVVEGKIAYFAPGGGGFANRDLLTRVELIAAGAGLDAPGPFWLLWQEDGQMLAVPSEARGAAGLVQLVETLPGARLDRAVDVLGAPTEGRVVVWTRDGGPEPETAGQRLT